MLLNITNFTETHDIDMSIFSFSSDSVQFMTNHQSVSAPKQDPSLQAFLTSIDTMYCSK